MAPASVVVQGFEAIQAANARAIAAVQPAGALGRGVIYALQTLHGASVAGTVRDTGTLASSHEMEVSGLRGRIYIASRANPTSGGMSSVYGPELHARGGRYAFYGNAFAANADAAGKGALQIVVDEL